MLTVTVCLVWSGNSSTCRPLPSTYSVMPSTDVTLTGAGRVAGPAAFAGPGAGACFGVGAICAAAGPATRASAIR